MKTKWTILNCKMPDAYDFGRLYLNGSPITDEIFQLLDTPIRETTQLYIAIKTTVKPESGKPDEAMDIKVSDNLEELKGRL